MGRPRKKHVQQELVYWGGKREGAGRPRAKGKLRSSERHTVRPEVKHPQHVTLRIEKALGTMRRRHHYQACRKALRTVLGRDDFRIVDLSLQNGHLHLIAEADNKLALARGMKAFQISAAKHLNTAMAKVTGKGRRKGRVFTDRYHCRALTSPLAVRHARAYVLNNWRRHGEDVGAEEMFWTLDPFSSAISFDGWKETGGATYAVPEDYEPLPVSRPQTWLLTVGWRRHGLISAHEVPGPKAAKLVA